MKRTINGKEYDISHGSNLHGSDLSGSDLSYSNLSGSNLSYSNLRYSNLSYSKGILRLPVSDPRGYQGFAVWTDSQWIIYGGCHKFTVAEARAHWGNDYSGDRATGEGWLFALNWLDNQPQIYA